MDGLLGGIVVLAIVIFNICMIYRLVKAVENIEQSIELYRLENKKK